MIAIDLVKVGEYALGFCVGSFLVGLILMRSQEGKGVSGAVLLAGLLMIVGGWGFVASVVILAIAAIVNHH